MFSEPSEGNAMALHIGDNRHVEDRLKEGRDLSRSLHYTILDSGLTEDGSHDLIAHEARLAVYPTSHSC
jgi:hypothetical protein